MQLRFFFKVKTLLNNAFNSLKSSLLRSSPLLILCLSSLPPPLFFFFFGGGGDKNSMFPFRCILYWGMRVRCTYGSLVVQHVQAGKNSGIFKQKIWSNFRSLQIFRILTVCIVTKGSSCMMYVQILEVSFKDVNFGYSDCRNFQNHIGLPDCKYSPKVRIHLFEMLGRTFKGKSRNCLACDVTVQT